MAVYTTIDNPGLFFNTVLYTGNGSTQSITGVGFQPDWVWLKARNHAYSHQLFDVVRGATKLLSCEETSAEQTLSGVTSFDSDGFAVGSDAGSNASSKTFASWNWLTGSSASSNSDGSTSSTVSVNQTAGFSIVSYTGTGSATTVGHGLGAIPQIVITKNRSTTGQWAMYNRNLGANKNLHLEVTDAAASSSAVFNDTESTSSVFSVGNAAMTNNNGSNFIAYCFAEKQGYSKFGSYTGNGSSDGVFVYTGFRPALVIIKRTDNSSGGNWLLLDSVRDDINAVGKNLYANVNDAETSTDRCDFVSNGFKLRQSGTTVNTSSGTYIYMAFAEAPFVTAGTKAAGTAR